jgi:hypothetical protein
LLRCTDGCRASCKIAVGKARSKLILSTNVAETSSRSTAWSR